MESFRRLLILCRGDAARIAPWLKKPEPRWLLTCAATIVAGCALYGAVVGLWRAPEQALYTAIKMPLLIFLTCGLNALLNGLLAHVLGAGLGFRQCALIILMSFTIAALVLACFSPIALFILINAPPLASAGAGAAHSLVLLMDVLLVAYAGVLANRRLLQLLRQVCVSPAAGTRVFWSWLAGNLFLGAQLAWVLRPFIGDPSLTVQFLRPHPMHGTFYDAVLFSFTALFQHPQTP
jgi:hypothetical protein